MVPPINEIDQDDLLSTEVDNFWAKVADLIAKQQQLSDEENTPDSQLTLLAQIVEARTEMQYAYPANWFADSAAYRGLDGLYIPMIKRLYNDAGQNTLVTSQKEPSAFAHIIANMTPDKLDTFTTGLLNGDEDSIVNLYLNEVTEEARDYQQFSTTHQFLPISNGNSINFKITSLETNETSFLKIENRGNGAKKVEAHLINKISEHLSPIHAERQAFYQMDASSEPECYTLIVTDCFEQGDLLTHAAKNEKTNISNAGKIMAQMAHILLKIQKAGCMFPDPKLTNWLIDDNNQLKIADTKSFLFTDNKGQYAKNLLENKYQGFICTEGFEAPEFPSRNTLETFDADKAHAYLLGKNLYFYLNPEECLNYDMEDEGSQLNFDKPIYATPIGKQYKTLIEKLVKPNPADRMPMKEALQQLILINLPIAISSELKTIILELQALESSTNPHLMDDFILDQLQAIEISTPEEQTTIINNLTDLITTLKKEETLFFASRESIIPTEFDNLMSTYVAEKVIALQAMPITEKKNNINELETTLAALSTSQKKAATLFSDLAQYKIGENDTQLTSFINQQKQSFLSTPVEKRPALLGELEMTVQKLKDCQKKATTLFSDLAQCKIGENDTQLTSFIDQQKQLLLSTPVEERPALLDKLETTLQGLEASKKQIAEVVSIVAELKGKAGRFTIGYNKKAAKIEQTLLAVPIEERTNILVSPKFNKVMEALASHRVFGRKEPIKTANGEIDVAKAAKSFQRFKDALNEQMATEKPDNNDTHQPNQP